MTPPRPRARWPDVAAAGMVTASVLSHLLYVVTDARYPRDLSLFHAHLPADFHAMESPAVWRHLATRLVEPGGGYDLFIAAWLHLLGRGPHAIQALDLLWITAVLVLVALVARRVAGPAAGAVAAAVAGAFPLFILLARLSWIHVPETALALGALGTWMADPGLRRRSSLAALAVLGSAALLMRHSALMWFGSLGAALAIAALRRGPDPAPSRRAVALLAAVWLLASLPVLLDLSTYVGAKLGSRETYVENVPDLGAQMLSGLGPPAAALAVVGTALALWPPPRRWTTLLAVWASLPLLLYPIFHAGLDNFLVSCAALAILAGVGLAAWPRAATSVAAAVLALYVVPQWLPAPSKARPAGRFIGRSAAMLGLAANPSIRNHYRAYDAFGGDDVISLIDASCAGSDACVIAVDQGLFLPYGEEPGAFELFLADREDLELRVLARSNGTPYDGEDVAALAHFDCPAFDTPWRQRYPESLSLFRQTVDEKDLQIAWARRLEDHCHYLWFTPDGAVPRPDLLPGPSDPPPRRRSSGWR